MLLMLQKMISMTLDNQVPVGQHTQEAQPLARQDLEVSGMMSHEKLRKC